MQINGHQIMITSSLGVAVSDMIGTLDTATLIRAADSALYRAKAVGRNHVELATVMDVMPSISLAKTMSHS
jgi:PleD family two-component response regulator